MYTPRAHLRQGFLRPYCCYHYEKVPFCAAVEGRVCVWFTFAVQQRQFPGPDSRAGNSRAEQALLHHATDCAELYLQWVGCSAWVNAGYRRLYAVMFEFVRLGFPVSHETFFMEVSLRRKALILSRIIKKKRKKKRGRYCEICQI